MLRVSQPANSILSVVVVTNVPSPTSASSPDRVCSLVHYNIFRVCCRNSQVLFHHIVIVWRVSRWTLALRLILDPRLRKFRLPRPPGVTILQRWTTRRDVEGDVLRVQEVVVNPQTQQRPLAGCLWPTRRPSRTQIWNAATGRPSTQKTKMRYNSCPSFCFVFSIYRITLFYLVLFYSDLSNIVEFLILMGSWTSS